MAMFKRLYANLLGEWVDITDSYIDRMPAREFLQGIEYEKGSKVAKGLDWDYVLISHDGNDYRIHPSMLQMTV